MPTPRKAGRRPARGAFERREQRGQCSRPRRSCLFGSPSCPAGPGRPHPWPPLSSLSPSLRAPRSRCEFPYRLASTRRIRPPRGPACRQSRTTPRRRCASAGSRFRPWRNRRDDAGQARCPVHRACCLFMFPFPPPTGIVPVWSRPTPPGPVWHHQIPRNSRVAALHAIPHSFPLRPAVRKKGMHQVSLYLFAYNKTKWCVLEQNASAAILSCTCQSDRVIATRWSGASVPGMAYRGEQEAGKC